MKKTVLLALLAIAFFAMPSCKKEDAEIVDALLGTYIGTAETGGVQTANHSVTISRSTAEQVLIEATTNAVTSSFYADITVTATGWKLTVPLQAPSGSIAIEGNSALIPADPDAHGAFTAGDGQLSYSVIVTDNGTDVTENYQGYKQ